MRVSGSEQDLSGHKSSPFVDFGDWRRDIWGVTGKRKDVLVVTIGEAAGSPSCSFLDLPSLSGGTDEPKGNGMCVSTGSTPKPHIPSREA